VLCKCWVGSLIGDVDKDDERNIPRDRSALSQDLWLMSLFKEERAFSIYMSIYGASIVPQNGRHYTRKEGSIVELL